MNELLFGVLILVGSFIITVSGQCPAPILNNNNQEIYKSNGKTKIGVPFYQRGDRFYYNCKDGYHFKEGSKDYLKLECTFDGWFPPETTKCTDSCNGTCRLSSQCVSGNCVCDPCGTFTGKYCKTADRCIVPRDPLHGKISIFEEVTPIPSKGCGKRLVKTGTRLQFRCNQGYSIKRGSSSLMCTDHGWNNGVPVCEKVTCPAQDASVKVYGTYSPMKDIYIAGSVVKFHCNENYNLQGESSSTCTENGSWDQNWPKCVEKQCKKSVFLLHGYIRSNNRLYNHEPKHLGDVLTFTCSKGYVLDGPKSIECQSESRSESILEWSPRPPQCITYRKCRSQGMIVSKNSMYCEQNDGNDNTASTNHPGTPTFSTGKPLTIVTAIAGGLLLLLLLLISIVACQRKRLNRRRSGRSGRRRLSSDVDRMSFVYSNNVHVMLPSYDEAMQNQRLNFPPPYAADAASTVQPNATEETPNAASTTTAQQERNDPLTVRLNDLNENIYETIGVNPNASHDNAGVNLGVDTATTTPPIDDDPLLNQATAPLQKTTDDSAIATSINSSQNGSPKVSVIDYTQYDGPANEQIYAQINDLMRDNRNRHVEVSGISDDARHQIDNEDNFGYDENSDTEALLHSE